MIRLLDAYCFYADFPPGLPVEIKYRLLLEKWDAKFVYIGEEMTHIEFCNYAPESCPFPANFCSCKDFLEELGFLIYSLKDLGYGLFIDH